MHRSHAAVLMRPLRFNASKGSEMRRYLLAFTLSILSTFSHAATTSITCSDEARRIQPGQSVLLQCTAHVNLLATSIKTRITHQSASCKNTFNGDILFMDFDMNSAAFRPPGKANGNNDWIHVEIQPAAEINFPSKPLAFGRWNCNMTARLSITYTPPTGAPAASPTGAATPTCGSSQGCSRRR